MVNISAGAKPIFAKNIYLIGLLGLSRGWEQQTPEVCPWRFMVENEMHDHAY